MTVKEKIVNLFELNRGTYLSGEEIAKKLDVSRAAVWKAVNKLKEEGYPIKAVTNKGYCLSENTDILSVQGIQKYLDAECDFLEMEMLPTIDSTNSYVWKKAGEGAGDGYTVIAREQAVGRGRTGRVFFSPKETGIYISTLLRPKDYNANQALQITTMAAVAICEAIEEVSDKHPQIKWVNDIFIHGKKVCGILTEASFSLESGLLDYAVLGLGINVYPPMDGFPKEIEKIAGVVSENPKTDFKNQLVAAFLRHFVRYYKKAERKTYIQKYRDYSLLINKEIYVIQGKEKKKALAYDINEDCQLLVRYENGMQEKLSYGEVQIVNQ